MMLLHRGLASHFKQSASISFPAADENRMREKRGSERNDALQEAPRDTAIPPCDVTARRKGVVEKSHAWRHLAMSVRIFLNNFARDRHNPFCTESHNDIYRCAL